MLNEQQLQDLVNGMNARMQQERASQQLTLGQFIAALKELPPAAMVSGLGDLMSYRGYYCDLAFDPETREETVAALLARCQDAMGRTFEGYKGGDFLMGETTPLWVAPYGSSGERVMGLRVEGERVMVTLATEHE